MASTKQINEFVKRARAAKIHAHIIGHLKKEMPAMMGKAKAQQKLIDNLADEFGKVPIPLSIHLHTLENTDTSKNTSTRVLAKYGIFLFPGSKRVSFTTGGLPECGAVQGGTKGLQHRQV